MEIWLQAGFCLLHADAWFEPAVSVDPATAAILERIEVQLVQRLFHHDGDADVGGVAGVGAFETGLADADDGKRVAVNDQLLTKNAGITCETRFPVAVAENGVGMAVGCLFVIRRKNAAQGRGDAQHVVIRPRDQLARDALGLAAEAEAHRSVPAAEHSVENLVVIAEVGIHRVGDFGKAVITAVVIAAGAEQHQLLGILDGETS